MKRYMPSCALLLTVTASAAQDGTRDLPLVVKTGETRTIPAQRWEYARVEIQAGGTLRVTGGSAAPLQLIVAGDMILKGDIVYEGASAAERQVTVRGENGQPLVLDYRRTRRGGIGGDGRGLIGIVGGAPARGDTGHGGGGGGGASQLHHSQDIDRYRGANAQNERGGRPGQACGHAGGDGAIAGPSDAGGVVVLQVAGRFDGGGGRILLRGTAGRGGAAGLPHFSPGSVHGCTAAASGGGGGAPGGQGGFLVAHLDGGVADYPQIETNGGAGGPGGQRAGTVAGGRGEDGAAGSVHWFVARVPGTGATGVPVPAPSSAPTPGPDPVPGTDARPGPERRPVPAPTATPATRPDRPYSQRRINTPWSHPLPSWGLAERDCSRFAAAQFRENSVVGQFILGMATGIVRVRYEMLRSMSPYLSNGDREYGFYDRDKANIARWTAAGLIARTRANCRSRGMPLRTAAYGAIDGLLMQSEEAASTNWR